MRILILSSLPADTGSAVRAANLSKGLKKAGLKARLVKPLPKSLPLKLDMLFSLPYYIWAVLKGGEEIVLAVKSYPNVGLPLLIKKALGAKVIIDTDDLAFAYSRGIRSWVSRISQEAFLPLADLHTYHCPRLLAYLESLGIDKAKTCRLEQGIDLEVFKNQPAEKLLKLKKKLGLKSGQILVFAGHFDIACDLREILKALPLVFEHFPKSRLLLAGGGPRQREFKLLAERLKIEKKLIWTGLADRGKAALLIDLADVCLLYYRPRQANYYRSSLKLREYLSLGKKVVCNDTGELKSFRDYTYQTKTRAGFGRMILKVLKTGGDGREKNGRRLVRQFYSLKKTGRKLAQKLAEI